MWMGAPPVSKHGHGGWAVRAETKTPLGWVERARPGRGGVQQQGHVAEAGGLGFRAGGGGVAGAGRGDLGEPPSPGRGEWERGGWRPWEGLWTSVEAVMSIAGRGARDAGRARVWRHGEDPPGEGGAGWVQGQDPPG